MDINDRNPIVNTFIDAPIFLHLVSINNEVKQSICYLGNIPPKLKDAVIASYEGRASNTQTKMIQTFYGTDWQQKLLIGKIPAGANLLDTEKKGGDNLKDSSEDELAEIERALSSQELSHSSIKFSQKKETSPMHAIWNRIVMKSDCPRHFESTFHIYPDDKLNQFRDKIYLTTKIPPFRQHILFQRGLRWETSYRLFPVDINNSIIYARIYHKLKVAGINIDTIFFKERQEIKIEALDSFELVGQLGVHNFYLFDLNDYLSPNYTQLSEIIRDTYQFDMVYYGFIVKYFPFLSPEAFYDYIADQSEFEKKYIFLIPALNELRDRYNTERRIIDYDYQNLAQGLKYMTKNCTVAITRLLAQVDAKIQRINIRALFDKLNSNRCIPEIHAYLNYNGINFLARKYFAPSGRPIQFPSVPSMRNGIVLAISMRKSDQDKFFYSESVVKTDVEQSRYLFFGISETGSYQIRGIWNDEDELGFEDVIKIMKKFIDPLITHINSLGILIFPEGGGLIPLKRSAIKFRNLNICIFWKKVLLPSGFVKMRDMLELYYRANMASLRSMPQLNKCEILWRKGMYRFDPALLEKVIVTGTTINMWNNYMYLTNPVVRQKWMQNYEGRIVKITHRTADIKFEIIDIDEMELPIFRRYFSMFIFRANNNPDLTAISNVKTKIRKIRKLREQDPELYDLKKYNARRVYSTKCQPIERHPFIYTDDEYENLDKTTKSKLTKFWNFTLNKPAYYGCPNSKYPYLSFITGVHPRGYCLPCCAKKPPLKSDVPNKVALYRECLDKYKITENVSQIIESQSKLSTHIMSYGKELDIGRLSFIPEKLLSRLILSHQGNDSNKAIMNNKKFSKQQTNNSADYYLLGVTQNVPSAYDCSVLFAAALGANLEPAALAMKIIKRIETESRLFLSLVGGILADYFDGPKGLINAIKSIFVEGKIIFTIARSFIYWQQFFIEILSHMGIFVIFFVDETLSEKQSKLKLVATNPVVREIINGDCGAKLLIMIKRGQISYPIITADQSQDNKMRTNHQLFFGPHDILYKEIVAILKFGMSKKQNKFDVAEVTRFLKINKNYKIDAKYCNANYECFGLLIRGKHNRAIYISVEYSPLVSDGIKVFFDVWDREKNPVAPIDLKEFIDEYNKWPESHFRLEPKKFVTNNKKFCAIVTGNSSPDLWFYFSPDKTNIETLFNVKKIITEYDLLEVSKSINLREPARPDKRIQKINGALYKNYLYQIFLLSFVNYFETLKNVDIHKKLETILHIKDKMIDRNNKTEEQKKLTPSEEKKYSPQFILINILDELEALLLPEYRIDFIEIRNWLQREYSNDRSLKNIYNLLNYRYSFDNSLVMLKNRADKLRAEKNSYASFTYLIKILYERVYDVVVLPKMETTPNGVLFILPDGTRFDPNKIDFPNFYLPCGIRGNNDQTFDYCHNKKLIICDPRGVQSPKKILDDFVSLLAAHIENHLIMDINFGSLICRAIIEYFEFNVRPGEIIKLYRLS